MEKVHHLNLVKERDPEVWHQGYYPKGIPYFKSYAFTENLLLRIDAKSNCISWCRKDKLIEWMIENNISTYRKSGGDDDDENHYAIHPFDPRP